ncbi:unnamed protein product [Lymnaea stagnalis]|uniref:Bestrophin homolog n=1 Tax=Lymnaea stagnalis TaxID=6523 RepID=A0AAV2I4Z9_LYMST
MGWLKVAEQMINPFGEDDDDYDINWLLDRHTAVAFCLTDHCYGKHPTLVKDQFWDDLAADVPYTESSLGSIRPNFLGTTFNIERPTLEQEKMVASDHEDVNNTNWANRSGRGKGSITGSLLSLLHRPRMHGSEVTLESQGSGHGKFYAMPNGRATRYSTISRENEEMRRSSVDLPVMAEADSGENTTFQLRQRANTDSEFIEIESKSRKMSLPFQINLFSKPKISPKSNRFTVEPVKDPDSETESANKTRRTGHVTAPFQNIDKVSRIPELSAIEEGNTITSLSQIRAAIKKATFDDDQDLGPKRGDTQTILREDLNNNRENRENRRSYISPGTPLILELEEDYATATASSEPNSPSYHYFDAIDTMDGAEESLLNHRRVGTQGGSVKKH